MSILFNKLSERYRYFSGTKLSNWGRNKYDYLLRSGRISSYPHLVIMEPCNVCNLRCPLCPTGQRVPVARGTMSMGTFTQIIDQLFPYVRYLGLYYLGEPLLCEHLPQMIRYARHHKIKVFVSSNLNILDNKQADDLIESKLDYLIVSLDGTSQESYEKYRVGGDCKKVIENIRLLIDKKNEKKSPYPRLVIQPVVFRHNEDEVPKLHALADHLGVKISIRQGALGGKGQSPPVTKDSLLAEKWLSPNKKYHKEYDYLSDKPYLRNDPCYFLWKAVTINWDGSVFPCCWIYDSRHSFGNILKENFETIWNNDLYRSSRSLFSLGKSTFLKSRGNSPETICYQCKIFKHHLNTSC